MMNIEEDPNLLILSPIHHYYYDFDEIKNVKTLIHIKELNKISNISKFLTNIDHILSKNANFIGCFRDNKLFYDSFGNGFINWLISQFDYKENHFLSRKKIINLFKKHRFEIIDITIFEGLTYFCVKKY